MCPGERRHRLRRNAAVLFMRLHNTAPDMALTVAVQEVDEQADDSPENEHQLRAVRQAEEEINAARDRDWSSKIKARCAERTAPMRIGLAQHHNGDRHCGEGEQRTGIGNVSQLPNREKCGEQRYKNARRSEEHKSELQSLMRI